MKRNLFITSGLFILLLGGIFWSPTAVPAQKYQTAADLPEKRKADKPAVLVELFTSEGCPICPAAELLLETLGREQPNENAEIVALAFHVDYWNRSDWKDIYSSPVFSRRQDIYAYALGLRAVFTPLMVIDGQRYFGGIRADRAHRAINQSLRDKKAEIKVSAADDKIGVQISAVPTHNRSTVYLAIAEDDVPSGRRRGQDKTHFSVVRRLQSLGMLSAEEEEFTAVTHLQFDPGWKRENLRYVVFIQENRSRRVIGVGKLESSGAIQKLTSGYHKPKNYPASLLPDRF